MVPNKSTFFSFFHYFTLLFITLKHLLENFTLLMCHFFGLMKLSLLRRGKKGKFNKFLLIVFFFMIRIYYMDNKWNNLINLTRRKEIIFKNIYKIYSIR